jgi:hypothetical protein
MTAADGPLDPIGRTIGGRYRVESVLGRGGMGAVYRVRDVDGPVLALKRGWARDPSKAAKRQALLQREYCTLAQLAHPRIIEVYDYGIDERGPYYTMELLDGADLESGGKLPWREACAVLHDVASSLAILHSRRLLHRDVSARNVRRTADGRAKLIDFGALSSMETTKDVVGTPPFVAPEVLQMQTLDARSDLYSLGALGYFLLTGRHAYPARRLNELRDVWRSAPAAPHRVVHDVPQPLSALIVQLLALDRGARPRSAAEVMTRVAGVGGLAADEPSGTSDAYLTTPLLVGREQALVAVRRRMLGLGRGDGGVLLIEGLPGSGRSRMLDACALEAKLLGATVLRADATDAARGEFGVAQALCSQLFDAAPNQAGDAARFSADVLGSVVEELRGPSTGGTSASQPERSLVIRELRDFVLALSRTQSLVIIVDDADRIDEPSAALIAAIADKVDRNSVVVAVSMEQDARLRSSLAPRVLRSLAVPITLVELGPEQSEALLRSVFNDAANVALIAGRIHAIAQGNPRATMELAQHLVGRGLARYSQGRWTLPSNLDEADLPRTLQESLRERLHELSEDARQLAEALALASSDHVPLTGYPELVPALNEQQLFAALDELVAARVLERAADCYHFSQRGFLSVLRESTPEAHRIAIHRRLATLLAHTGGDVVRRAHHLFAANEPGEAIALLSSIDLLSRLAPLPLLVHAVAQAEQLRLPARVVHWLRMALLTKAPLDVAIELFKQHAPAAIAVLERDSGLLLYRSLAHVPESERLGQALVQAQQQYLATPEHDRVHAVSEAIRELGRLQMVSASVAVTTMDMELLDRLPTLKPLLPLSPTLEVMSTLIEAARDWVGDRNSRGFALGTRVLERIAQPDRAGLDDGSHMRMRLGVNYTQGLYLASLGSADSERYAAALDADRELRVNAWRVRQLLHLNQGDVEEAARCQRRAELLQLQEGLDERYGGTNVGFELAASSASDDVLGIKRALDGAQRLAARLHTWLPIQLYGESRLQELEGDFHGALDKVEQALELATAGRHPYFGHLAASHVRLLATVGRMRDATAHARAYLAVCERDNLLSPGHALHLAAALVLAPNAPAEAVRLVEAGLEAARAQNRSGLALGAMLEARARLALRAGDRARFEHFTALCAKEYGRTDNPALLAKLSKLLDEARQQGVLSMPPEAASTADVVSDTDSDYATVQSRMRECVDVHERSRCALTLLLQNVESRSGYLYAIGHGGVALLSGLPDGAPPVSLDSWVRARVEAELGEDALDTDDSIDTDDSGDVSNRFVDRDQRSFEVVLLGTAVEGVHKVAAAFVHQVSGGPRIVVNRSLVTQVAKQLLEHGDTGGVAPSLPPSVPTC